MDEPLSDDTYKFTARETRGRYLVGLSPMDFFEEFMPWNEETTSNYKQQVPGKARTNLLTSVPPGVGQKTSHMRQRFTKALDGLVTGTDNDQKLRFGHFAKPDLSCASMNVDVSTYREQDFPVIKGGNGSKTGPCTFSLQQTHAVLKYDLTHDAFEHECDEGVEAESADDEPIATIERAPAASDPISDTAGEVLKDSNDAVEQDSEKKAISPSEEGPGDASEHTKPKVEEENLKDTPKGFIPDVETDTPSGILTRGQLAAYAGVAMSMAFRTHFFSMLILGKYARFIRWDRCGAIVTTRFDYIIRPELIFDFYLRFGQLSPAQRGLDTSATRLDHIPQALPDNVAQSFDSYYQRSWYEGAKFSHHRNFDNQPQKPAKALPFFRILVQDYTLGVTEAFFIPAPVFRLSFLNPFSRGSRRSLAFLDDANNGTMCFLKESWQEISLRSAPEVDIYRLLRDKGVQNIATLRLGGDVSGLETKTQNWFDKLSHDGWYKRFRLKICHRLVLDTVGRDLSTFTWSKVLLSCAADAVDAAQQAYKAGVLHRDISVGNVIIVKNRETGEWRGLLIDWEMSLLLEKVDEKDEMRTARTGTWAFMSVKLLQSTPSDPVKHTLADDMESFFWVLAYQLLRYTEHNKGPHRLYKLLQSIFSESIEESGTIVGGDRKRELLFMCSRGTRRLVDLTFAVLNSSNLNESFFTLAAIFHHPYGLADNLAENDDGLISPYIPNCPAVDLENPDDKWISNFLRQKAAEMKPLGVTITALKSPTNDSKPPNDSRLWENATIAQNPADYSYMPHYDEYDPKIAEYKLYYRGIKSSFFNHVDGEAVRSNKRPVDEEDNRSEQPGKKIKSCSSG